MKDKNSDLWYPMWVDKWLFGSTRHEFSHAQRAIWVDLLTLSKKDEGYIRANEGIPYPVNQLAGLFNAPTKLVADTIRKAIETNKLKKLDDGTLYIINTDKYELSKRHRRRVKAAIMAAETDTMAAKAANREEKSRVDKENIEKKKLTHGELIILAVKEYDTLCERFGEKVVEDYIQRLNFYIGSKGKKYKSHYYTLLSWFRRDNIVEIQKKTCDDNAALERKRNEMRKEYFPFYDDKKTEELKIMREKTECFSHWWLIDEILDRRQR